MALMTTYGVDYSRISDDDAGQRAGVTTQAERNAELAGRHGIELAGRYADNSRSAANDLDKRDDFRAMLGRISRGDVRYVLAWHPDRLLRSVAEGEEFISLCRQHKVLVLTVTAGEFDLSTAYGRKAFRDAVNGASYESEHRGERVNEARIRQARNGAYGGGVRPYGWGRVTDQLQRVRNRETGEWDLRPFVDFTQHNEAEVREIRKMRDQLLAGVEMAQIIRDLKRRDVPTAAQADGRMLKRGKRTMEPGGWNSRSIRQILTHPRVAGHAVHHGKIVNRDAWPSIISEDERQACETILSDPARKTSPGNRPKWLLSLIARCGVCGDGGTVRVRNRSDGLPVYVCSAKGHNGRDAAKTDDLVTLALLRYVDEHGADLVARPSSGVDVKALRQEDRAIAERIKKLAVQNVLGDLPDDAYDAARVAAQARRDELAAELATEQITSPVAKLVNADAGVTAAWEDLTIGEAREVLKECLTVTIMPGKASDVTTRTVKITP